MSKSADLTGSACQSPFGLLISHVSYLILTTSYSLTLISCILYLGGEFEGREYRVHNQPRLNPALRSYYAILYYTILYYTILYYTVLYYTYYITIYLLYYNILMGFIPYVRLHTQMRTWSYLEISGAICSYLELSGTIGRPLYLSGSLCSSR